MQTNISVSRARGFDIVFTNGSEATCVKDVCCVSGKIKGNVVSIYGEVVSTTCDINCLNNVKSRSPLLLCL